MLSAVSRASVQIRIIPITTTVRTRLSAYRRIGWRPCTYNIVRLLLVEYTYIVCLYLPMFVSSRVNAFLYRSHLYIRQHTDRKPFSKKKPPPHETNSQNKKKEPLSQRNMNQMIPAQRQLSQIHHSAWNPIGRPRLAPGSNPPTPLYPSLLFRFSCITSTK